MVWRLVRVRSSNRNVLKATRIDAGTVRNDTCIATALRSNSRAIGIEICHPPLHFRSSEALLAARLFNARNHPAAIINEREKSSRGPAIGPGQHPTDASSEMTFPLDQTAL